jgi:cytochrome c oxidase subunit IV
MSNLKVFMYTVGIALAIAVVVIIGILIKYVLIAACILGAAYIVAKLIVFFRGPNE